MTLRLTAGKLLFNDTEDALAFGSECCCCSRCADRPPDQLSVTIDDPWIDDVCTDCDQIPYSGTFVLDRIYDPVDPGSNGCFWSYSFPSPPDDCSTYYLTCHIYLSGSNYLMFLRIRDSAWSYHGTYRADLGTSAPTCQDFSSVELAGQSGVGDDCDATGQKAYVSAV